jgi:hypothetical protein
VLVASTGCGGGRDGLLKAAAERDQLRRDLRREASSGATSGVRPAPARPPSRRWFRDFQIRTKRGEEMVQGGVFRKIRFSGLGRWGAT